MVGVPAMAAEDDDTAEYLATSMYLRTLGILRGERAAIQPPVRDIERVWNERERLAVASRMALFVVGGPERVREGLQQIVDHTQADEIILVSDAYRREDRLQSFEILAKVASGNANP